MDKEFWHLPPLDATDIEPSWWQILRHTVPLGFKALWNQQRGRWFYLREYPTWFLHYLTHHEVSRSMPMVAAEAADEIERRHEQRSRNSAFTNWWADPELYKD